MEPIFRPTVITYQGHFADHHLVDGRELGRSLEGFTRLANVITNFYLDGEINSDKRLQKVQYYIGVPKENGVLYELVALMATGHLPVYAPILLNMAEEFLPIIWKAVLSISLGRRTEASQMLDIIKDMAERKDAFARQVHEGHMRDKAWLQDYISELSSRMRAPLKEAVAPVGNSVKTEKVWPSTKMVSVLDEPAAEVLRSTGNMEVGDQQQMVILLRAVNLDTGSGQAEILDIENLKIPVRITDPILSNPENIYSHSLDQQTPIMVMAKPTILDGKISKLFISDAKLIL